MAKKQRLRPGRAKDKFFRIMQQARVALTFDDVRLKTRFSNLLPEKVLLETKFSRNIRLKIPIVSAAMDSVTEYELAIELAKLGGIGVIHKNMTPEQQAFHVARVKNYLNGRIDNPTCVYGDETIGSILRNREEKEYQFHCFPVLSRADRKIMGILTRSDFDFCDNLSLSAKEAMTNNVLTKEGNISPDEAYSFMKKEKKKHLPLVNSNNEVIGLYTFKDLKRIKSGESLVHNLDANGRLRVASSIGVGDDALSRLEKLIAEGIDCVVIGTAHGASKNVLDTLKEIKKNYTIDVIVGNFSETGALKRFLKAGADGILVGQGPGSICTTRVIAGIGCPQVTAVYNCSLVADEYGVPVCSDGGLRYSGDITIAIGAGAHSVMMGKMLAGVKETPGGIVFANGRQWKEYRGMGSLEAMESAGSRERYSQDLGGELIPEGVTGLVPYSGSLREVIVQYLGGLKKGMCYLGVRTIEELIETADFYRITSAGKEEAHPHDILITKKSPNYQ